MLATCKNEYINANKVDSVYKQNNAYYANLNTINELGDTPILRKVEITKDSQDKLVGNNLDIKG